MFMDNAFTFVKILHMHMLKYTNLEHGCGLHVLFKEVQTFTKTYHKCICGNIHVWKMVVELNSNFNRLNSTTCSV